MQPPETAGKSLVVTIMRPTVPAWLGTAETAPKSGKLPENNFLPHPPPPSSSFSFGNARPLFSVSVIQSRKTFAAAPL